MRPLTLLALLLMSACDTPVDDTASSCPAVTDPCMNEDNYQDCLDVEATCNAGLLTLESCPLQFACGD